jgi:hypothetical protein
MVKHAARRMRQGLHNYLLDRQADDEKKAAARAAARERKRQEMAVDEAGEKGKVKGLKDVEFSGQFGVTFSAGKGGKSVMDEDEEERDMMDGELDEEPPLILAKSIRKQNGVAISRM